MQNDEIRNKSTLVLFTPGNEWNDMILELITWEQKALIIGSRKDTLFNVQNLNKLNDAKHCQVVEIPDADHSLEVDNITLDLANLSFIMSKVKAFIDGFSHKN